MKIVLFSLVAMFVLCTSTVRAEKNSVLKPGGDYHPEWMVPAIMPQTSNVTAEPLLPSIPAALSVTADEESTTALHEHLSLERSVALKPP